MVYVYTALTAKQHCVCDKKNSKKLNLTFFGLPNTTTIPGPQYLSYTLSLLLFAVTLTFFDRVRKFMMILIFRDLKNFKKISLL